MLFGVPTFVSDANVRVCVIAVPVYDRSRPLLCPSIPCIPSSVVVGSVDRRTCCDNWLVQVYVHRAFFCFLLDTCCEGLEEQDVKATALDEIVHVGLSSALLVFLQPR
jgi:hypothetical protein